MVVMSFFFFFPSILIHLLYDIRSVRATRIPILMSLYYHTFSFDLHVFIFLFYFLEERTRLPICWFVRLFLYSLSSRGEIFASSAVE